MVKRINFNDLHKSDHGWLQSSFHFSFAEYFNANNMSFGALRVMNDDLIAPHTGFESHPHKDMEIFTYILDGKLTHKDSMNNQETLVRGDVQYMSAGTGVIHSEKNENDEPLRIIQTWIMPDANNYKPSYGSKQFEKKDRHNHWLLLLSNKNNSGININQDVEVYVSEIDENFTLDYNLKANRQVYLKVMEGSVNINGVDLMYGDGAEISDERVLNIKAINDAHIMLIDLNKEFV